MRKPITHIINSHAILLAILLCSSVSHQRTLEDEAILQATYQICSGVNFSKNSSISSYQTIQNIISDKVTSTFEQYMKTMSKENLSTYVISLIPYIIVWGALFGGLLFSCLILCCCNFCGCCCFRCRKQELEERYSTKKIILYIVIISSSVALIASAFICAGFSASLPKSTKITDCSLSLTKNEFILGHHPTFSLNNTWDGINSAVDILSNLAQKFTDASTIFPKLIPSHSIEVDAMRTNIHGFTFYTHSIRSPKPGDPDINPSIFSASSESSITSSLYSEIDMLDSLVKAMPYLQQNGEQIGVYKLLDHFHFIKYRIAIIGKPNC